MICVLSKLTTSTNQKINHVPEIVFIMKTLFKIIQVLKNKKVDKNWVKIFALRMDDLDDNKLVWKLRTPGSHSIS